MTLSGRRQRIDSRSRKLYSALRTHIRSDGLLAVVKAPPGSGKTFTLLRLAADAIDARMRVAIGAQTNAQADDICRRLAHDHPEVSTTRFAAGGRGLDLPDTIDVVTDKDDLPVGPSATVSTIAKWSLTTLPDCFDLLFVDEAWQMSWADFMLCSRVAGRFVLIGDPGQIPPVVTIGVERWETSPRAPHHAAPEVILSDPKIERLEDGLPACRRLPPDAVDLVRSFYDFEFDGWADPGDRQVRANGVHRRDGVDDAIDALRARSVVALTLPTPEDGPPLELDDEIAGLAADVAARLLDRRATAATEDGGRLRPLRAADIGIVATHRVVNSAIRQALPAGLRDVVRVDTPERWQGLERPIMIAVHPLSGVVHPTAFDLETGRLCVMASRHRAGLVIVTRDHLRHTLESHIPAAEQAVGRPDVTGRGHDQHLGLWGTLEDAEAVIPA